MNKRQLAAGCLGLIAVVTIAGCASMHTHSDYDPQVDFGAYRTYAWASEQWIVRSRGGDTQYVSPLDLQRIKTAIESEFATKGFSAQGDRDTADFYVSFTVGARDKIDVDTYPVGYRGRWVSHWPYHDYYGAAVEVHSYTEGTLAIDVFDRASNRPVWHGLAKKRITGADTKDSGPLIRNAVASILSEFPPN